jgi:hypothetical protein
MKPKVEFTSHVGFVCVGYSKSRPIRKYFILDPTILRTVSFDPQLSYGNIIVYFEFRRLNGRNNDYPINYVEFI